jgi:two-component system OmpR family response regulator
VKVKKYKSALIIDDDSDICIMLKSVLSNVIDSVQFTHTLASGKKMLSGLQPDIVFLDNNLPDGQGINVVNEIKDTSPSSLVIFITASRSSGNKALETGADAFLEKPLTYSSIFEVLGHPDISKQGA